MRLASARRIVNYVYRESRLCGDADAPLSQTVVGQSRRQCLVIDRIEKKLESWAASVGFPLRVGRRCVAPTWRRASSRSIDGSSQFSCNFDAQTFP